MDYFFLYYSWLWQHLPVTAWTLPLWSADGFWGFFSPRADAQHTWMVSPVCRSWPSVRSLHGPPAARKPDPERLVRQDQFVRCERGQLNGLFLFNPDFLFGSTTVVSDAAGKICCCWTSGEQDGSDPPYTCRIWLRCGNRDQEYLYTLT